MLHVRHKLWLLQRAALSLLIACLVASTGWAQFPPGEPQPPREQLPAPRNVQQPLVSDVRITGNETVEGDTIISYLRTRKDRVFDPEILQADKRRLSSSGLFRDVRIYTQQTSGGMVVTFEVFERPTIRYIRFHGNKGINDRALLKQCGLEVGDPLNFYAIEESRRKVEDYYHTRGFPKAEVRVVEGNEAEHRGATLGIAEGPLQRIAKVEFVGNEFVSDGRLKTQIESKPGFLWYLFRGKVDEEKIEQDIVRLTEYYRSLGFFRARIGRELAYDDNQEWLSLRFVIDEGPRYVIRSVQVAGSTRFNESDLLTLLELKEGEYFNSARMARDESTLRELSQAVVVGE